MRYAGWASATETIQTHPEFIRRACQLDAYEITIII